MRTARFLAWAGLLALLLASGCASSSSRTAELLGREYAVMSDAELEAYYLQLNDEIARTEREATGTRVGVGVGSYPVHIGASTGVSRGSVAEELRERRNEVRLEMTRRGLRP